jgi:hypothetical protein
VSAIAFAAIKAAIHSWVVAGSGLAAGQVYWTFPGENGKAAPRPQPPCIALQLDTVAGVGHDWRVTTDAEDPEPGAELEVHARGHRIARLELQCFGLEGSGLTAMSTLVDVIAALPLHHYALDLVGVGIGEAEAVQLGEFRRGGILEPRGVTAVQLHLGSEVIGTVAEVKRVQVTTTARDAFGEVIAESEQWIPDPPVES